MWQTYSYNGHFTSSSSVANVSTRTSETLAMSSALQQQQVMLQQHPEAPPRRKKKSTSADDGGGETQQVGIALETLSLARQPSFPAL